MLATILLCVCCLMPHTCMSNVPACLLLQLPAQVPQLQKSANPAGVNNSITPEFQSVVSKAAQAAAEAEIQQGGNKV